MHGQPNIVINTVWVKSSLFFLQYNQLDAQFFEFIEYHSTCFGRSFRPASGICHTGSLIACWRARDGTPSRAR
jgi:hypothetical protein